MVHEKKDCPDCKDGKDDSKMALVTGTANETYLFCPCCLRHKDLSDGEIMLKMSKDILADKYVTNENFYTHT